jgi:methyl-accepting chemotaxis protein
MLKEINESVMRVNDVAAEIAAASAEQTKEINEINLGLSSVNQIVQQNSSISEQAASAAEILATQAIKLQQLIGEFTLKDSSDINQLVLNPPENDSYPGLKQVRLIEA